MFDFAKIVASKIRKDELFFRLGAIHRYCGLGYSVAKHSYDCANFAAGHGFSVKAQLLCLLHDCEESIIGDIPAPIIDSLNTDLLEDILSLRERVIKRLTGIVPTAEDWEDVNYCDKAIRKVENPGRFIHSEHDINSALVCIDLFDDLLAEIGGKVNE